MKSLRLLLLLTVLTNHSLLYGQDSLKNAGNRVKHVIFVTHIDLKQATKDGVYLNGYVVNIPYHQLVKLNGKKVQVSGKVTIAKGLNRFNDGISRQGRQEDFKYILKPKIKIIDG